MKPSVITEYERKLSEIPKTNKGLEEELQRLSAEVGSQNEQLSMQSAKIKALEGEMIRLDKALETRENELQELTDSEEKNTVKEKKYFMQIENYNNKIQALKAEINKVQQGTVLAKKQLKNLESNIASVNLQKNRQLQTLTKGQMRVNALTQQLNDLKLKMMEKPAKGQEKIDEECKRDEKQIGELFAGIKKQIGLIDVLKKQKVHVIASTIFKYCEQEFSGLLEMGKK